MILTCGCHGRQETTQPLLLAPTVFVFPSGPRQSAIWSGRAQAAGVHLGESASAVRLPRRRWPAITINRAVPVAPALAGSLGVLDEWWYITLCREDRIGAVVGSRYPGCATDWVGRGSKPCCQSGLAPAVEALQALRGVRLVAAATLVAELGDITRFTNPRQLMAYLGLVPSEHSSGRTRRQAALPRPATVPRDAC